MSSSEDLGTPSSSKKRKLGDDSEGGRKRKKKKTLSKTASDGAIYDFEQAALMGEIPDFFHMQMSELLKEARMKKKQGEKLIDVVGVLSCTLLNLAPGKPRKLHLRSWMKGIKMPVLEERTTKGRFEFRAPSRVYMGGSSTTHTCVLPSKAADMIMEMPKECFQPKDWLNHRYVRKRAMYLAAIAIRLSKTSLVSDMKFTYHHGNPYKPILILTIPVSVKGKPLIIHLHAIPDAGVFKPSRFHITKNNVRPRWFWGQDDQQDDANDDGSSLPSTPIYNSTVLQDVCYDANAKYVSSTLAGATEVQDAIALLKIWLHQRQLDVGYGGFSGFLMSILVCHLMKEGHVLPSMNSLQIFRITLMYLSKSQWQESPISLCPHLEKSKQPTVEEFQQEFDIVFIDVTGYLNLALGMTTALYNRVIHEADLALQCVKTATPESFSHLFTTPCPFVYTFDDTVKISLSSDSLDTAVKKLHLSDRVVDQGGVTVAAVVPSLLQLLHQGLGDRILLLQAQPVACPEWSLTEPPPPSPSECTLGLLYHKANALRLLDRGPAANAPEAVDFRQFWGEKSELRRFKDGGISEAVVWASSSELSQKRAVCSKIVSHVLNRHASISLDNIHAVGQKLDHILHLPRRLISATSSKGKSQGGKDSVGAGMVLGTGEERIYRIRQELEEFYRTLRKLSDLALRINSVSGIHPVFRFSEVFPALPAVSRMTSENLLKGNNPLPLYTPALTVICSLEGSGHWPEDVDRLRDLKTLYLIDLSDKLQAAGFKTDVQPSYLDVVQNGYVFRLKLGVRREVGVLRMVHSPTGMLKMEDTPQALAVEHEITTLPDATTLFQGVQQDHPSFSVSVRVIKRWMASQLLLGHVPDLVVERTVVHLYRSPMPATPPGSPVVALLRFLRLVSSADYKVDQFCDKVTPAPPLVIMNWWRAVAKQSLSVMNTQPDTEWQMIFKPPLTSYDMIIHLDPRCSTRRHQAVKRKDVAMPKYPDPKRNKTVADEESDLPVLDFNPPELLLADLERLYGEWAVFFHDRYGGDVIAVLLKPQTKQTSKFEINSLFGHKPTVDGGEPALIFDVSGMTEAVKKLGGDIVTSVTVKDSAHQS